MKLWATLAFEILIVAAILFAAAGTLRWVEGWVGIALMFGPVCITVRMLQKHNPELLQERMRLGFQEGQPLWDRVFVSILIPLWIAWFVLLGLDGGRFHWSPIPVWLEVIGGVGMLAAAFGYHQVFKANAFATTAVRIQEERKQTVITTGPYAVVRHPLYAAAILFEVSLALLLGSWIGLVASLVFAFAFAYRVVGEERELLRALEGYSQYAQRIRYRLIPGVW